MNIRGPFYFMIESTAKDEGRAFSNRANLNWIEGRFESHCRQNRGIEAWRSVLGS
jgi:hypothetical protein